MKTLVEQKKKVSLALFCRVVDNFGDVGICWRLARQLESEQCIAVTLWVDNLRSFQRLCPEVVVDVDEQRIAGVTIRHWPRQDAVFSACDVADSVIEFFGCNIPDAYIAAMADRAPHPVWLNLEGLSAEEWVEGCHTLPSPHPTSALTKYFFFPGFTDKTGGLLHEAVLEKERARFQSDPAAAAAFLARLGVTPDEHAALKVSLFCYPHAPVAALLDTWQNGDRRITCLVPEGVATAAIEQFLGSPAEPHAARTRGALCVRVLPFVAQPDYDRLLWACDLNFVRGEDSFVRAQWAGRPFLWHIYPQDENLHHVKLRAFLQRYAAGAESLVAASLWWNGALPADSTLGADWPLLWPRLRSDLPDLRSLAGAWTGRMLAHGDLASNLMAFAESVRSKGKEIQV